MNADMRPDSLLRLLPPIRRARAYRLYGTGNERFLDLWQDGGRGVLGAKGYALGTLIKNEIDRGVFEPLGSCSAEAALIRELLAVYPRYAAVRFFRNEDRARAILDMQSYGNYDILVPFSEYSGKDAVRSYALLVLPCPSFISPAPVLFQTEADASAFVSDFLAPVQLKAAFRALREFRAYAEKHGEKEWESTDIYTSEFFTRRGPLLCPRPAFAAPDRYADLFRAALSAGILLSPVASEPSIIPGEFDQGEFRKLAGIKL